MEHFMYLYGVGYVNDGQSDSEIKEKIITSMLRYCKTFNGLNKVKLQWLGEALCNEDKFKTKSIAKEALELLATFDDFEGTTPTLADLDSIDVLDLLNAERERAKFQLSPYQNALSWAPRDENSIEEVCALRIRVIRILTEITKDDICKVMFGA